MTHYYVLIVLPEILNTRRQNAHYLHGRPKGLGGPNYYKSLLSELDKVVTRAAPQPIIKIYPALRLIDEQWGGYYL